MRKIEIISLFCLLLIPAIFARIEVQPVYSVQMEIFRDDTTILQDISIENGTISSYPVLKTDYSIKVLGARNRVLFDRSPAVLFTLNLEPYKIIQLNSSIVHVRVPYFDNAEKIVVYHFNKEILTIDLSKKICNNNLICEIGENEYNCSRDCKVTKKISFWLMVFISILIPVVVYFCFKKLRK